MTNPKTSRSTSVVSQLADRVLIQASCPDALKIAGTVAPMAGGMVVTGPEALQAVGRIRRANCSVLLCADTAAETRVAATAEAPFELGEANLIDEPSLQRSLDAQRERGASVALTPTGHIAAGDSAALKAAIRQTDKLQDDDIVVRLPCDVAWATKTYSKQLAAVIATSNHPVALSLAADQDPLTRAGVAEELWAMAATHPHLILWRTDLAGLAHLVNGGLAAAIGFSSTLRHGTSPDRPGFVNNRQDRTPDVLLPDWMRYMKGSKIETVFAATSAPRCHCRTCRGQMLDRFDSTTADKLTAHLHNAAVLQQLIGAIDRLDRSARHDWWRQSVALALTKHTEATAQTNVQLNASRALRTWSQLPAMAG